MWQIGTIAVLGAVGAVARYAVSGWAYRVCGESFPYGTLVVNLIGCFLLGAVMHLNQTSELIPEAWRQAVTVGMLGAFTTFSTFGYESLEKFESGQWQLGSLNIALSLLLGLFAVWLGATASRLMYGGA